MSSTSPLASTTGIVSGINWGNIVSEMMAAKEQPLTALEGQQSTDEQEEQVYTSLEGSLSSLQSAALSLSSIGGQSLDTSVGSSTDSSVASVAAQDGALTAGAELEVLALAGSATASSSATAYNSSATAAAAPEDVSSSDPRSDPGSFDPTASLASQGFNTAPDSGGALTVNGVSIAWTNADSLDDILGLINSASAGVTATYDASTGEVSIAGNSTGSASTLSLGESSGNLLEVLNLDAGTVSGSDATAFDPTATLASQASFLNSPITAGTFSLNGITFEVDPATDSLDEVLQAINSSGAGVQATFDSQDGLVDLSSTAQGSSAQLTLGASGDTSNLLSAFNLSQAGVTQGQDAQVSVNGGAVEYLDGNTSTSLLPGGTVTLSGTGTASLGVGPSASDASTAVQNFVNAYNSAVSAISGYLDQSPADSAPLTGTPTTQAASPDPGIQGAFIGNPLLQQTLNDLVNLVNTTSAPGGALTQLSQIGVTLTSNDNGEDPPTLSFDQDTFTSAFAADPGSVNALISDPTTGLGQNMYNALQGLVDPTTGSYTNQINGLSSDSTALGAQISTMQTNLTYQQNALMTQYEQLEATLETMQSQGDEISATLSSLSEATVDTSAS